MREMRRKDRAMDEDFAYSVIDKAGYATLATINEDGSPYCIPVSFAREGNRLYLHSAYQGAKMDNIRRNPQVCLSFVGEVQVPPPRTGEQIAEAMKDPKTFGKYLGTIFTTEYESAVIFGTATIIEDREEKIRGLKLIAEKYTPWNMPYFEAAVEASLKVTCVLRIEITAVTGKRKKYDKDGVEMKWGRME